MKQDNAWTDEQVESLKKLWAEGLSCSAIARQVGISTKSAVIGKLHRLGLAGRAQAVNRKSENKLSKAQIKARPTTPFGQPKKPKLPPPPKSPIQSLRDVAMTAEPLPPAAPDLPPLVASVLDLESHHCRWIPGEPSGGFCGRQKVQGLPYCECHALRAFDFTKPRRRGGSAWVPSQAFGMAHAESKKLADVGEFLEA